MVFFHAWTGLYGKIPVGSNRIVINQTSRLITLREATPGLQYSMMHYLGTQLFSFEQNANIEFLNQSGSLGVFADDKGMASIDVYPFRCLCRCPSSLHDGFGGAS